MLSLALAAAVFVPIAPAAADTTSAPLVIKSCVVAAGTKAPDAQSLVTYTNGVTVVLTNASEKPISAMTLSGTYDGVIITDTVHQAVAPGATVTFKKSHTPLVYQGPNAACRVDHVVFADGTTWTAPVFYK